MLLVTQQHAMCSVKTSHWYTVGRVPKWKLCLWISLVNAESCSSEISCFGSIFENMPISCLEVSFLTHCPLSPNIKLLLGHFVCECP